MIWIVTVDVSTSGFSIAFHDMKTNLRYLLLVVLDLFYSVSDIDQMLVYSV